MVTKEHRDALREVVVTRWAITCRLKNGLRGLIQPAQGRYMRETREEAERQLMALLTTNSAGRLEQVFGPQSVGTFRVDPFECWWHGDPKSVWADD